MMEIWVGGCVKNPGTVKLPRFAKLRAAISAANGFKRHKLLFPSGLITVRSQRKLKLVNTHKPMKQGYVRKKVNARKSRATLDSVRVYDGDRVIVQFGGLFHGYFNRSE